MGQLQVEAEGTTRAAVETVWSLVSDANTYSNWGPWIDGGYDPSGKGPSQPGSIQWFKFSRRTTSVEKILEVDAPSRIAYTVVRGIPVKNYRAEVTLTPDAHGGTSILWAATWDTTLMGRLVHRRLQAVYRQVMDALIAATDSAHLDGTTTQHGIRAREERPQSL
jgi:uncharacterized protein YndB with AHSA1/START domain